MGFVHGMAIAAFATVWFACVGCGSGGDGFDPSDDDDTAGDDDTDDVDVELEHPRVSTGSNHTCAVDIEGNAECWGDDLYDQTAAPSVPILDVAAGHTMTYGLTRIGSVLCWGSANYGVCDDRPDGDVVQIDGDEDYGCGLLTDGSVVCWGD